MSVPHGSLQGNAADPQVNSLVVRGRLYELPSDISILDVPEADVLAHGTADPLADVATQARLAAEFAARAAHPELGENDVPGGRWGPVYGELLTFDDPETRLPAIDHLEGFLPGGPSLYRRVLIPVKLDKAALPAWLYAGDDLAMRKFAPLGVSRWSW
ncbi:Gamma-glutamyl cyclotransferase, AIG2-like [Desulfacinum infernum DSM 9756]|uniref:Gamma-glutamyl cyclotransferase, AIG2-like n=1 Tax=Desulfacinum infernum DSM 9756 TaxID=1121391 RepID=A0A1M5IY22_9BACT|nr:Gamma-glutamyl cyclotransferase, AIG2-like [Desulfacinum infernum DSM 9756]